MPKVNARAEDRNVAPSETHRIAPSLAALAFPVADLVELPGNPRRGDVEAVARSYERFGQRKPIVCRRDGDAVVVIAGNHQLMAARQLGWSHVAVAWADDLDEDDARGFALADNRVAELGGYDDEALLAMMEASAETGAFDATAWTEHDLDRLRAGYAPGAEGRRGRGGTGWFGDNAQTTVLEFARPKASREHPTMKPVDLIVYCLTNSSAPGHIVLDLFGGSGSTLIAAHMTGRTARLMELDPGYVDVICRRYQEATGDKPINAATGRPHDFTQD